MGIAVITLIGQIVGIVGPLGLEELLKIKSLLQLSQDIQVNIKSLADVATTADDDVIARVNAWRASLTPPLPPL